MSAPMLVTDRLELWLPRVADAAPLFEIVSDKETSRYLGPSANYDDHFMRFSRNAGSWYLYAYGMFMLRERGGDGSLIGNCGIFHSYRGLGPDFDDHAEAGWILSKEHAGKGYASEAMQAVLEWFDEEHGKESTCMIVEGNKASMRLADKLGFVAFRTAELPGEEVAHLYRRPAAKN